MMFRLSKNNTMNFERYAPDANMFLKEIAQELGNPQDTEQAYRIMKSVFHSVREILSPQESLHMLAQLPLIIKGVYVDGWHIPARDRIRSMPEFLECLRNTADRSAARDFGNDDDAIHKVKCVLNVLKHHITTGEIQHMIDQFPMELSELWLTEESDAMNR
jgi:uncharacterized protein (DUF2267 family)